MKEQQRKEYFKNTHKKYTISVKKTTIYYICKKDNKQKQLEVAIRELRRQLQEEEEKRSEVETKYKNLQKIHESTKIENKIYQTEIQKLKHEKDTAEEVMKALRNDNFNKIQISSATDKEQQMQNLIQYWKKNRV